MAAARALSMTGPSVTSDAIFSSIGSPLCMVPSMSPGPRSFKSASETMKPSVVEVITSRRRRVSLPMDSLLMRMQ